MSKRKPIAGTTLTVQLYRREETRTPSPYGGENISINHRVPNGTLTGNVFLSIDIDDILRHLGEKALRSKSGRSRAMSGAVEVTVDKKSLKRTAPEG